MAEPYPRPYARYVLLERLGVGGMSEVDLARNRIDDGSFVRFAVIKRIKADYATDESFVRMFKDEARITSELHHANIGTVYDFGRVGDEWYLALEYVPGVDLRLLVNTLRERGQRVPLAVALRVVVEVLQALSYAHDKRDTFGKAMGIVHRDVNPRNVMLSIRGEVKLIDFGVAKATDRLEQTRADHVKGKFAYMAPEQLTGTHVDQRSDLFAVGLVLHELLTGVSPYYGLNQVQILHRMVSGTVPELPAIPELADDSGVRRIHDRALAPDPAERYPTAAAFADDLRALADAIGGLPTQDQLATFLNAVDPELTSRLQRKMERYARVDHAETEAIAADGAVGPGWVGSASGSAPREVSGTMARQPPPRAGDPALGREPSVARTGLLAGGVLLVSVVSALVAGAIVAAALIGAWWLSQPPVVGAVEPVPAEPAEPVELADPVDPVRPAPAAPVDPVDPAPARVRPAPAPAATPDPAIPPAPAPAPEIVPEIVPLPDPEPPAPPVPAADGEGFGYLNVVRGDPAAAAAAVQVDGAGVGDTPVQRLRVPSGPHTVGAAGLDCKPTVVVIRKNQTVNVVCR